jgi:hypothetical protein
MFEDDTSSPLVIPPELLPCTIYAYTIWLSANCILRSLSSLRHMDIIAIPYSAIILLEPPLIDRQVFEEHREERFKQVEQLRKAIAKSRNAWPSKEAAREYFSCRSPWKSWDRRALDIYVVRSKRTHFLFLLTQILFVFPYPKEHGLRCYTNSAGAISIVTKCSKASEQAPFTEYDETFNATEQIERVCSKVPIHIIFGVKIDMTYVLRFSSSSNSLLRHSLL